MRGMAMSTQTELYSVVLECGKCGRTVRRWQLVDEDGPIWREQRARFQTLEQTTTLAMLDDMLDGGVTEDFSWTIRCQGRSHGRPCSGVYRVRNSRLIPRLELARNYERTRLVLGLDV